jgi:prepilin-type processing-associated H-X9-DG protein
MYGWYFHPYLGAGIDGDGTLDDRIALRHNLGSNILFADFHVEYKKGKSIPFAWGTQSYNKFWIPNQ